MDLRELLHRIGHKLCHYPYWVKQTISTMNETKTLCNAFEMVDMPGVCHILDRLQNTFGVAPKTIFLVGPMWCDGLLASS